MARTTQTVEVPSAISSSSSVTKTSKPVSPQELTSLYTALAHAAHSKNIRPEVVQAMAVEQFGVQDIAHIGRQDLQKVLQFLDDLSFDEIRSKK